MNKVAARVFAGVIAVGVAFLAAVPAMAIVAAQENYSWYVGHENDSSYTIATAGDMAALAKLVNGTVDVDIDGDGTVDSGKAAVDFAGKSIKVVDSANVTKQLNYINGTIEPIGTAAHPFKGDFDGNGFSADNFAFTIAATDKAPVSNIGLFGYVGAGGSVSNFGVGKNSSISIERAATSSDYIENVGMVVGYCAGSLTNCTNAGALTIASSVAQKSEADYIPVRNVGGVAGQCVFDVAGCANSGAVNVTEDASPDGAIGHGQLVARVGGVVGLAGDAERVGTYDKHVYGEADKHGAVSGCVNTAKLFVDTPKVGGLDRFGQQTNAESVAVGGVVGYSQGSVTDCVNGLAKYPELGSSARDAGYVRAENGVMVGGVCGSLRGVLADNMNVAWADDGADGKDPIELRDCTNYGDVYGRATVGGVAGKTSSYTTVTECLDLNKVTATGSSVPTFVVATRWNKPAPAGIVGIANGEVSYCANLATVASAVWKDEANRTMTDQSGYYAAGIVGMLSYFGDQSAANGGMATPVSEIFSCYNAGSIVAKSGMRQRGIVGENGGFTHDNVLLKGVVEDDNIVYGDDPDEKEASGTTSNNKVFTVDELRGEGSADAVAHLNSNSAANGWERFWVVSPYTTAPDPNGGYPLLDRQNPWTDPTSLEGAMLTLVADAAYTGGVSIPDVKVTLGGKTLTANADYHVLPQDGATEVSSGRPYAAKVAGLGRYGGTSAASVSYGITTGDFSLCTVTVAEHTFDYDVQLPTSDDVVVRTPVGTVVDPSNYVFAVVDSSGAAVEPVDVGKYRLLVTPAAGSKLFKGTLEGEYRVKAASLQRDVSYDDAKITYLGVDYPWRDSTEKGESDNPTTTLPYTGVSVQPLVSGVTYNGHTLEEGVDYKVVYGNPNSDDGNTGSEDVDNAGRAGGTTKGCVTVRYITSGTTNFTSYANMFFNISDQGEKTDLAQATYRVDGQQLADGMELRPVKLFLGAVQLTEGVDYTIEYADNVSPGTASFTATGVNTFTGTLSGTFEIEAGELVSVLYDYEGTGGEGDPLEATVTGAEYNGTRDTFTLEIPEAVEHDGSTYAVVAIGDKAFGGSGRTDFTGSVAATSKTKLSGISVPAGVRSVGSYAFGTASNDSSIAPALSSIDFGEGSQLESIGDYAFARCASLQKLTLPAKVASLGKNAFRGTGLSELRFLTADSSLPSSVYEGTDGSFATCVGTKVYGFESAAAVRALAEANSGTTTGKNGGKQFTFTAMASLASAVVADIPAQAYTGGEVKPAVSVTLDGAALREGTDFTVSYFSNVAAGTARAVVMGAGTYGGQIEKEFTIEPAPMASVEMSNLADKAFDGQPAAYEPRLAYKERRLVEGTDYELSYADGFGTPLSGVPSEPGSYRLVATGKGNFTGTRYRAFRIVAVSLADAEIEAVGRQEYTGAPVEPSPNVKMGGSYLVRDRDYVVTYAGNVEVGEASLTVRGVGDYEGSQTVKFGIVRASLGDKDKRVALIAGVRDVALEDLGEDGAAAFDDLAVVLGGRLLEEGVDYDVSFADGEGAALEAVPSEAGSYRLVATGKGNYQGTAFAEFAIVDGAVEAATDLADAEVVLASDELAYNGTAQVPEIESVTVGGVELEKGSDYIVSCTGNLEPGAEGAATLTVHGIGDYAGSKSVSFTIAKATISAGDVADIADVGYAGGVAVEPVVVVTAGGRSLVEGLDFEVGYSNNTAVSTDAAKAKATVTGIGGYAGTVVKEFRIAPADLSRAVIGGVADQEYTGAALKPVPTVAVDGIELGTGDYDVSYDGNVDVGTASVVISGKGNYTGSAVSSFAVTPFPLSKAKVSVGAMTYSGKELKPEVTVRADGLARSAKVLAAGEYAVSYASNVNAGRGKVTVTGLGNFGGSAAAEFVINPLDMSKATVSVAGATYTGSAITPAVTVRLGGAVLAASNYTVAYASNVNAGTAKVTVRGTGNYAGTASGSFAIAAADLSQAKVTVAKATYTGKALKPAVTVTLGGRTLAAGSDYALAYSNNKNASTSKSKAKVTATGKGNYRGTAAAAFSIAQKAPALKVKAVSKTVKVSAVKKKKQVVSLKPTSPSKGKITYKVKKANKRITFKNGKATLKKGTKKGTYSIKVTVTQAAKGNYAKTSRTTTITFKVKKG